MSRLQQARRPIEIAVLMLYLIRIMGCCSGKQGIKELGFSDSELQETNLHHKQKQMLRIQSDSTELSASSENITFKNHQKVKISSPIPVETIPNPQKSTNYANQNSYCHETNRDIVRYLEIQNQSQKNEDFSTNNPIKGVSWENIGVNCQNIGAQTKQRKLYTVVNGPQLRIRFGPLHTINEEESQYGDTAKLSQASRKQFSNLNLSNFPHE